MWNLKKYNKLVNTTKKRSRLTDIENKPVVTSGGGEGQYRGGGTIGGKIGYNDVLYNTGNIVNIL